MINRLLLIGYIIGIFELTNFIKLRHIINKNLKIYNKIIKLFSAKKLTDVKKEKLILFYSKALFLISIKLLVVILIIFFFLILIALFNPYFLSYVISLNGILEVIIISTIYYIFRFKNNEKL